MAKATDTPDEQAYSSTVRKVLNVKSDGTAIDNFSIENVDIDEINVVDYHTNSEALSESITDTSSNVTFTQDVYMVVIHNTSNSDTIYVSFDGDDATTDDYEIEAGSKEFLPIKVEQATGLDLIGDNAGGTTVKLLGLWTP